MNVSDLTVRFYETESKGLERTRSKRILAPTSFAAASLILALGMFCATSPAMWRQVSQGAAPQ